MGEKKREYLLMKAELFQSLTSVKGMKHLIDTAANIIGNPIGIGIIDDTVRYLSPDMPRDSIINCPDLFQKFYTKNVLESDDMHPQKNNLRHIPKGMDLYEHVGASLQLDGITVGYFSVVLCNRPFQPDDLEIVSIIKVVFQLALKTDIGGAFLLKIDNTNKILQILFEGERPLLSRYALWEELGLQKEKPVQVFVATYSQDGGTNIPILQLREQLCKVLNCNIYILKNKRLIFLCNYNLKEKKDAIIEVLERFGLVGGVSYTFYKLEEMKERYQQALDAIRLGNFNKDTKLCFYDDYIFFKITNELWRQKKLQEYCHPAALKLYYYDKKNGTSLLKTLQVYFSSERNLESTAKKLNIHRNTILRRLEKITEMTKSNHFCADSLYNIYLSTLLIDYYSI